MIDNLILRTGDTSIHYSERIIMTKRWEAYHPLATVASGTVQKIVSHLGQMQDADKELQNLCASRFGSVEAYHASRGAIGGLSTFDADLVLDGWMDDGATMEHPILGEILSTGQDLVKRVNAILDVHAPPPRWFWAEAVEGGVRTKCVAVTGAGHYNLYSGDVLLGEVSNSWTTTSLAAGSYSLRMSAVVDGTVGILSFPISVQVDTEELQMMAVSEPVETNRLADYIKRGGFWSW